MKNSFLEKFYENVILPRYSNVINFTNISWKDHGKVDLDAWAHYFEDDSGREYILLYEDFPGSVFLDDNLSHEIIKFGDKTSLELSFSDGKKTDNITGYFTLYREKF